MIKKTIFDNFPLEGVIKRSSITYVKAKVMNMDGKKHLLMTISSNKDVLKVVMNKDEYIYWHNEKVSRRNPADISWNFQYKSDNNYYGYGYHHTKKKVKFVSEADEKAFFGFRKLNKEDQCGGQSHFWDVFYQYCSKIYNDNAEKRKRQKIKEETKQSNLLSADLGVMPRINPKKYLPHYILHKNNMCKCTNCEKDIEIPQKVKHREMIKCPKCRKKVQFIDRSRKTSAINDIAWVVVPDGTTLRYVLIDRWINDMQISTHKEECARIYLTDGKPQYWEKCWKWDEKKKRWHPSRNHFFKDVINMHNNRYFNGFAAPYRDMGPFFQQLYSFFPSMTEEGFYWDGIIADIIRRDAGKTYELLIRAGYMKYAQNCSATVQVYRHETLEEILHLNRSNRRALGINPACEEIHFAQQCEKYGLLYNEPKAVALRESFGYIPDKEILQSKTIAKCNYLKSQITPDGRMQYLYNEWKHYINMCQALGYDLKNKAVLFPKDFRAMDKKISDEYDAKQEEIKAKKKALEVEDYKETISRLKKAMSESSFVKKLSKCGKGLVVKVPETPEELDKEHVALCNCLHTYKEKMAKGTAIIFFIRKVEDPDTAYFAMEYSNGKVQQIRGKNNCAAPPLVEHFGYAVIDCLNESPIIHTLAASVAS